MVYERDRFPRLKYRRQTRRATDDDSPNRPKAISWLLGRENARLDVPSKRNAWIA